MKNIDEKQFKILIADDSIQHRDILASKLRFLGFHVELASGGFHLLHLLEKYWDYSLVILHGDMGDMPAEEMISLVRTSKDKKELPILFISNNGSAEEIGQLISTGASEFVMKSTNFQPIVDRVQKYFTLLKNS